MKDLSVAHSEIDSVLRSFVDLMGLELAIMVCPNAGQTPDIIVRFAGVDSCWLSSADSEILKELKHLCVEIRAPGREDLVSLVVVNLDVQTIAGTSGANVQHLCNEQKQFTPHLCDSEASAESALSVTYESVVVH